MSMNPFSDDQSRSTIAYYDAHAGAFVAGTVGLNMSAHYEPFLDLLPPGAPILDAGCGSGRDSLYFLHAGYRVTAFDASQEMVRRASALTGLPVLQMAFQQLAFADQFQGIWASASLLHVPRVGMDDVLERLERALMPGGILYVSFKYGRDEIVHEGRLFNSYDENSFVQLQRAHPGLELVQLWTTQDVRPGRAKERWLNAILRR